MQRISQAAFGQFVQIACREEEKEENNGNCKALCVTRKRNKQLNISVWHLNVLDFQEFEYFPLFIFFFLNFADIARYPIIQKII